MTITQIYQIELAKLYLAAVRSGNELQRSMLAKEIEAEQGLEGLIAIKCLALELNNTEEN